jgi:simple sugar transport system ATP-binding protein
VFDEPTAVLTPGETETLFELFHKLRSEGCGIILITHKLDEALSVSDRVTVMRRGITLPTQNTGDVSVETLKHAIFGSTHIENDGCRGGGQTPNQAAPPVDEKVEPPVLAIKNLTIEAPGLPFIRNVNLELKRGKILGVTGVRDSGLETLELAIPGLLRHSGKFGGTVTLNRKDISGKSIRAFRNAGGSYLGADKLGSNLAPELPLRESLIIHAFRRARKHSFFLDTDSLDEWSRNIMKRAGIDRPFSDRADSFSGGMIQRILLAREFAEETSLILLAEAASGLDQVKRAGLETELKELARSGVSVLLFSTDADELISVADEIMVLRNGIFTARFILSTLSAADAKKMINAAMTETATEKADGF